MPEGILLMRLVGELNAVVGEDGVNLVRNGGNHMAQELSRDSACHLFMEFGKGKLGSAVDGNEQVEFALFGANLGNVDVKVANRVLLEATFLGWFVGHIGQTADAMPLQTAMQRGASQVRDVLL